VVAGVFVTAFYSFRMYFLVFHGPERFHDKPFPPPDAHDSHAEPLEAADDGHGHGDHAHGHADAHAGDHGHGAHAPAMAAVAHPADAHAHADTGHAGHAHADAGHGHDEHGDGHGHDDHGSHTPHESAWIVTAPLILLAIPSVVIGFMTINSFVRGDFFKDSIFVNLEKHPAMAELGEAFHGATEMALHGLTSLPVWLTLLGVVFAYVFYIVNPAIPAFLLKRLGFLYKILDNKYYMDWINEKILSRGARFLGQGLWTKGDVAIIDGTFVNGSASLVQNIAGVLRVLQTGQLYWYALVMVLGVVGLMTWQMWPFLTGLVAP
jgi:NADH:ubiquinone oxidoreductase subunit 5 (subunit L)/multisubunit Na+/H+ antiporter MnhA subunit